ncbi:MAG: lysylphosphatidylglycerol synthase transmembrane domain-containing protein [Rhodothermales bacterium]
MPEPLLDTVEIAPYEAPSGNEAPVPMPGISVGSILLSVLLSLAVLVIIAIVTFEVAPFRQMLHNLNPWLLAAAGGTVVLRVFFGGWRLNHVSHGRLGLLGGIRGQLAWDFFSNVTPSTIGGGPIASGYIAKDRNLPLGEATSIMLFSMLMDQIWFAVSIPAILGLGLYLEIIPQSLGKIGSWSFTVYFLGFMGWVIIFGYSTLFRPQLLEKLVDRVCRIKGLQRFHEGALNVMRQLQRRALILRSQRPGFYVKGFLLTLASWINRYLLVVFIIWSVYPALDKVLVLLRTIALTLGSVVLPTPGGAGGLEGLYAIMLGPLIPDSLVAPTLLTWRLLGYYVFIAIGTFLTMDQVQKSIRRRKRTRALTQASTVPHHNGSPTVAEPEPVESAD